MEFEVLKLLNEFGRKATKEDFAPPAAPEGEEGGGGGGGEGEGGGGGEGEEGEGVEEYSDADLEELKIVEYRFVRCSLMPICVIITFRNILQAIDALVKQ